MTSLLLLLQKLLSKGDLWKSRDAFCFRLNKTSALILKTKSRRMVSGDCWLNFHGERRSANQAPRPDVQKSSLRRQDRLGP